MSAATIAADNVTLNTLVEGDDPDIHTMEIQISRDKSFAALSHSIRSTYQAERGASIVNLVLYKFERPDDELKSFQSSSSMLLARRRKVASAWPSGTSISDELIHIVVQCTGELLGIANRLTSSHLSVLVKVAAYPKFGLVLTQSGDQSLHPPQFRELKMRTALFGNPQNLRESRVSAALDSHQSSSLAKASEFANFQKTSNAIYNGRPQNNAGHPIQLYHPVFDRFLVGLEEEDEPVLSEELRSTLELMKKSQEQYQGERGRLDAMYGELRKLLGAGLKVVEAKGAKADGVISSSNGAVCLVMEVKNEIGAGGSDPTVQAAISYAKYWKYQEEIGTACCCPAFILAIAGPWVCVLGAITLHHQIVQPLTEFRMNRNSTFPRTQSQDYALARMFVSLRRSIDELIDFYNKLGGKIDPERFFPHMRFCAIDETPTSINYEGLVSQRKLVFVGSAGGLKVVIKFCESYNADAHRLLAEAELAPRLLFVSSEGEKGFKVGNRSMIVMDQVPGDHLKSTTPPQCVKDDVRRALELLHEKNMVFGDLRPPNIMVVLGDRGVVKGARLVDFDWCRKEGPGKYPTDINTAGIEWPANVGPGTSMMKDHDWEMFGKIFGSE